jgi:hypothetical protein
VLLRETLKELNTVALARGSPAPGKASRWCDRRALRCS